MLKPDLYRLNKRLIQLFGYEKDGGRNSKYWRNLDFLFPERGSPFGEHEYGQSICFCS